MPLRRWLRLLLQTQLPFWQTPNGPSFCNSPEGITFFPSTSDQHFNIHPLVGLEVRKKATSLSARLNSLKVLQCVLKRLCRKAAIVWPCPWPRGQGAGGPCQQPGSHPAFHIPLQGCFLVLFGSADAPSQALAGTGWPSPPQGLQPAGASPSQPWWALLLPCYKMSSSGFLYTAGIK